VVQRGGNHTARSTCGISSNSVTGTINYTMDIGFRKFVAPISATACIP
jgi:hypothetical protein